MDRQNQRGEERRTGKIVLCLALIALPLFSSCGTSGVSDPPSGIPKSQSEVAPPRHVERVPVTSTHLQSVGYDESSRTLTVEFRDGTIYEYESVPPEVHSELMAAESHGKYFHREIRNAGFKTQRVH